MMTIEQLNGDLCITVRDEGAGVDLAAATATNQPSASSSKFGLFSIRERMLSIGGRLEIDSSPGRGMTACLILPLNTFQATTRFPLRRSERGQTGRAVSNQNAHSPAPG